MRLMDGFLTTQLVYVAARLGVAGVLADGPRTGAQVAAAVGADESALIRVLRGLAAEGVLEEEDGRFGLTDLGRALERMGDLALVRGELYYGCAAGMLDAVVSGGVAFERAYRQPFFDHLAQHPELASVFHRAMAGRAESEARDVVSAYDFRDMRRLVDVGGGQGVLLVEILQATPGLFGVLVDQEDAVRAGRERLAVAGLADRSECVAGDFFQAVPGDGDGYLLSRVLHDWSDEAARRILVTCRRSMPRHARLLVVDAVLPERAADQPFAVRMDLHMLLLFGARERTEVEFVALLGESGFAVQRVIPTASPAGLGVVEATPD
jgi:hypothetical protein